MIRLGILVLMGLLGLVCASSVGWAQDEARIPRQGLIPQPVIDTPARGRSDQVPEKGPALVGGSASLGLSDVATQSEGDPLPFDDGAEGLNPLLQSQRPNGQPGGDIGSNFFRNNDDFTQGLVIKGDGVAMKVGGYVKLDLIQDFNAIGNTDVFDVSSIPVGGAQSTNSRMHLRQTRLNFDTRWRSDLGVIRSFVEGDFFGVDSGENSSFRLRHAYGELGRMLGGQTFTTFANIDASPATLDFEGAISTITVRRAQVRWTQPILGDGWHLALALEDSTTVIELPPESTLTGRSRTISPDLIARIRQTRPGGNTQIAGITRILGFQPDGEPVRTENAWGLNFSQVQELSSANKIYWQINYGEGIASLLGGLPDATPVDTQDAELLGYLGWMVGTTHEWNERLSSNLTIAESHFRNTPGQVETDIKGLTYLSVNTIWTPLERFEVGLEYLYGQRDEIGGQSGVANRVQFAVFYYLP